MDKFYTQSKCDRCGGSLKNGRMMSKFNLDCLCMQCISEERQHPDYEMASKAEWEAVKRGERNFPGIGWPGKNGRVK